MNFIDLKDFSNKYLKALDEALKDKTLSKEEAEILTGSKFQKISLNKKFPLSACCSNSQSMRPKELEDTFVSEIDKLESNPELIRLLKKIFKTETIKFDSANLSV